MTMTISISIIISLLIIVADLSRRLYALKKEYQIFATMILYMKMFLDEKGLDEEWKEYYEEIFDGYENTTVTKIKLNGEVNEKEKNVH